MHYSSLYRAPIRARWSIVLAIPLFLNPIAHATPLTASPAAAQPGQPAPGTLEFDVMPSTGDVILAANNAVVLSYAIGSTAPRPGDLIVENWKEITARDQNGKFFTVTVANPIGLLQGVLGPKNAYTLNGTYDLGNILPAGQTAQHYLNDLGGSPDSTSYGIITGTTLHAPSFVIDEHTTSVPITPGTQQTATLTGRNSTAGGVYITMNTVTGGTFTSTDSTPPAGDVAARTTQIHFPQPTTGGNLQTWELSFDGTFAGQATVTFQYDPSLLAPGIDPTDLRIEHFTNGQWELLTGVVDPVADTITVNTGGFSPFALAVVPEPSALGLLLLGSGIALRRRR